MVFENILFIRGVVITIDQIREIVLSDPDMKKQVLALYADNCDDADNVKKFSPEWWDNIDSDCGNTEVVNLIELDKRITMHTWPCCSKLAGKMFVFGDTYYKASKDDVFENVRILPTTNKLDDKIMKGLEECLPKFSQSKLRTVMILDDCTECS